MPIFFNPFWVVKVLSVVRKEKIEVIIVRDIPLSLPCILIARICKVPVLLDMAENYPALWKDHVSRRGKKFFNHVLKNPGIAKVMESVAVNYVDHIFAVIDESKERIMKKGIAESKISIVSNTPDLRIYDSGKSSVLVPAMTDGFTLLYVGFITVGRGIDTVIRAIPLLKEQIPNIRLVIVGDGKYLDEIKILVNEFGIEKSVHFCGWVNFDQIPAYIKSSDLCIVPHDITEHVNSTIPNKLFDYMASKKPVVVSDAVPLKRIVEENKCGVVFKAGDPKSFSEKVLALSNSNVRNELGENGYTAVRTRYNWSKDAQRLKDALKRLEDPCDEILKYKIERGISSKSTIVCYSGGVEIYRAMLSDKSPADWWQGRWTFMDESRKRKVSTSLECIVYGKKGI